MLTIIGPQEEGKLACGDVGVGKMAEIEVIVNRLKLICSKIGERRSDHKETTLKRRLNRAFTQSLRRISSGVGSKVAASSERAWKTLDGDEVEAKEGFIKKHSASKEENESDKKAQKSTGGKGTDVTGTGSTKRTLQGEGIVGAPSRTSRTIISSDVLDYVWRFAFLCFACVLLEGLTEYLFAWASTSLF